MDEKMTLLDLVERLDTLDDNLTIYIEEGSEWSSSSRVVACLESEDGSIPVEAAGMEYFLEVGLAKDVILTWQLWRNGKVPSSHEACGSIIYCAKNDAYIPVQDSSGY